MSSPIHVNMSSVLHVIEVIGVFVFASSGLVEARRKKMDLVGVFTVAFITAFGGGTVRDILLDRRPLFWIENYEYPTLIFVFCLLVSPFFRQLRQVVTEKVIVYADALGLGLFSVGGTSLAYEMQMPLFVCVMMGVITGIFGGVLRDMICNEIPMVFRRGQLYATCAFLGCWVYLGLALLKVAELPALLCGVAVTLILRLLAVRFDLKLPG
ncbi:trimeric intracellular cation channel family protein [Undibacterium cyanobacteriorum]|uniref:Trimeric intracellular cation channel family protein n=1 Tax=Undibacterium cyanobacteriorum TaxID=3073561 RepID=A0ABY9RPA8_9BURK|nr:trimeric intracellular cation channel family protein [Undibacterium sp. 20NA77.5]WMW82105.1 trimeric intracellular cation channel family protein [Undibacterium sp. 20NA77.5]